MTYRLLAAADRSTTVPAVGIPAFDERGRLPLAEVWLEDDEAGSSYSGHQATYEEMRHVLCDSIPGSVSRPLIMDELGRMFHWTFACVHSFVFMVSGEFVVNKLNPSTVYVAIEVPGHQYDATTAEEKWLLRRLYADELWTMPSVDVTMQASLATNYLEDDHPDHETSTIGVSFNRWTASRPTVNEADGYVEIVIPDGGWS